MEAQIEQAVAVAWNSTSSQELKTQAFEFLNQLRSNPQAFQACTSLFIRNPRVIDYVRVVSLEVINNAIQSGTLDRSSLLFLKDTLLDYARRTYGGSRTDPMDQAAVQNKLCQTLILLFVHLYKDGWESFVDDFVALMSLPNSTQKDNRWGVFLFLRILDSMHDEIADLLVSRPGNELSRNSELKDLVRERDVAKIAASWRDILAQYSTEDPQDFRIVEQALKVLGKWVGWIDISLVVNQETLALLMPMMGRPSTGGAGAGDSVQVIAVETFNEIIAKKMKPADKIDMIIFLKLQQIVTELLASAPLLEWKGTSRYDADLAERVAKLVNTAMADIVKVLEDEKAGNEPRAKADQLLQGLMPSLLRLFSDEYDEVCSTVIPALTDVLRFFRKLGTLPDAYSAMLPLILDAIVTKMRYDETFSWGNEDAQTDEAEFQELRKKLQILQKSVAAVDQSMYIDYLSNLVSKLFGTLEQQGSQMDWRDLDLGLHEIYLFGELALPNAGLAHKSQPNPVAAERLVVMMSKMVESGIITFGHPAILLQYMEICVRYAAFFEAQRQYIPQVLENFVGLIHHDHVRIKTRSWYLFFRFVKQLRSHLGNVAGTVIQSISDLLPIKAEVVSSEADDDMSSDESDHSADAIFNSQLYLFEAVGLVSSSTATPADEQGLYARSVMEPLFADLSATLPRAKAGDAQATLQIHHIIMALGTLANGFCDSNASSQKPPPPKPLSDEFSRAAEAILFALVELSTNGEIRAACRSALTRLLGVLGNAVLPQLPQWIEGLLSRSSSKDEMAMFLQLLKQVVFSFKTEIYDILDLLLTPLLQRVLGGLSEPINGTDDEIQLQELRVEFVSFVQIILQNNLGGVLVSEKNQGAFESLISSILAISKTIVHQNMVASRISFSVLSKITSQWGGPDVATIGENPTTTGAPAPVIPGFDQFIIDQFHTACWDVLRDPGFRPFNDAQCKQILNEISGLQQMIYIKTGDKFVQHVQNVTFAQLGIDGNEYLRALTSKDRKVLISYFEGLLKGGGR